MGKSRRQVSWLPGLSHILGYRLWRAEHIAGVTWKWCDRRRSAACCSLAATSGSHKSLSGSDSFLYKCCKWDMHQGYSCITVCCNVTLSFIESLRSWIKGLSLFKSASQLLNLLNAVLEGSKIQREIKRNKPICIWVGGVSGPTCIARGCGSGHGQVLGIGTFYFGQQR